MDEDDKELVRRMMAKATAMLEDAVETAVAGQSSALSADDYADVARRLRIAACRVATLADATMVLARPGSEIGIDPVRNRRC